MKAYTVISLSSEQISKLESYLSHCESYMEDPEFDEVLVGDSWFGRKTVTNYRLKNLPKLLSCWCVQSADKSSFKIEPTKTGTKVFSLYLMLKSGQEVWVDDEMYSVIYSLLNREAG